MFCRWPLVSPILISLLSFRKFSFHQCIEYSIFAYFTFEFAKSRIVEIRIGAKSSIGESSVSKSSICESRIGETRTCGSRIGKTNFCEMRICEKRICETRICEMRIDKRRLNGSAHYDGGLLTLQFQTLESLVLSKYVFKLSVRW